MTVPNVCKSNIFYLTSAASDESSSSRSQKNHSRPWKLLQHLIVSADSFSSFVFYLVVFRLNDSLTLGGKKSAAHFLIVRPQHPQEPLEEAEKHNQVLSHHF